MTSDHAAPTAGTQAQPGSPVRTGWPAGMLQDDSRELSRALASKPDARMRAREAVADITESQQAHCATTKGAHHGTQDHQGV